MDAAIASTGTKVRSFMDLIAWQEGHKFLLMINVVTENFPKHEQFALQDQLRRAAASITSNIAEGFSRRTAKNKRQFYRIALSSLTEAQNQLIIARDLKYVKPEIVKETFDQSIRVSKLINGLIKSASDFPV